MSGSPSVNFQDEITNYEEESLGRRSRRASEKDIIDQSCSLDAEKVVEVSPNERFVRLNTLLGKGAYKIVYKAIDREEGYEVAWNTMQATKSIDNKQMDHEISILKSVRHPNIIAFHDAWYENNEFVFVTELMTSGTLREYIRKLNLPNLKIVKRWSRQILKGLMYLHDHNPSIIHRDIKCDNIFINGAHGEVKIGDMGTAEMKMGKKYTVIGTPEFMAPEMYEEQGYNEKVDIYAFGMCMLEMVTGDYPYGECKNAAQIYKKVSLGVKPASLMEVQNEEVRGIIENCLGNEEERMSAFEILEHRFLAVEPEIILLTADTDRFHLVLQVVVKGMDKLSVKFNFNCETDTAEQVVREMIEEEVLPERYQHHITKEINRLLRDIDKSKNSNNDSQKDSTTDIRSELKTTKEQLNRATEQVIQIESKCDGFESRAIEAEMRYREAARNLRELKESQQLMKEQLEHLEKTPTRLNHDLKIDTRFNRPIASSSSSSSTSHGGESSRTLDSPSPPITATTTLVSGILEEYSNDTDIETFVKDCAVASHRNADKAIEWAAKLKNQDIMTVGDLRDLHDEDWAGIGLTVFALRALKNMLKGKRSANGTPSNSARVSPPL